MRSVRTAVWCSVAFVCVFFAPRVLFGPAVFVQSRDSVSDKQLESSDDYRLVLEPTFSKTLVHKTPQAKFRDNLRNDTKYVTSWPSAGSTNDFFSFLSLIYIALNTDRVPIIPAFVGVHHLDEHAGMMPFSAVYDLPRLQKTLGIPILEWKDVKDLSVPLKERPAELLGCWSVHMGMKGLKGRPIHPETEEILALDISNWPVLSDSAIGHEESPSTANIIALAALSDPIHRADAMKYRELEPEPCQESGQLVEPDEQLLCFDYLFFTATYMSSYEHSSDFDPIWRWVGQFVHFNPALVERARGMLHRTLEVPENAATPAFITIHVRRGDFAVWCYDTPLDDCFAPFSDYAKKVEDIRRVLTMRGIQVDPSHVIITSDEKDPAWWAEVVRLGYRYVDHKKEETIKLYGKWYPTLIDGAIHTLAVGLVGTDRSTYSEVSRKRMKSWNEVHEFRSVLWGSPGLNN